MGFAESITMDALYIDPYPIYARLRREEPVAWVPALNVWLVTRREDVRSVIASPESFVTSDPNAPLTKLCGPGSSILAREGDAHTEIRASVDDKLAPEVIPGFVGMANEIATAELAAMHRRDGIELMSEYFHPVCGETMARTLGLGELGEPTLRAWSAAFIGALQNPAGEAGRSEAAEAASAEMTARLGPMLAESGERPDGSFLSALMRHGLESGETRSIETVLPTLKMIISGFKEPAWAAGNLLYALAVHPEQFAAVRADRTLLPAAVHEALRWLPPVGMLGRKATREVTLGGVRIPAGAMVAACIASACRDEREFDDAEHFDIHREAKPFVALGYGRHRCIAAAVIPPLVEVAVDRLLSGCPDLRVRPDAEQLRGWKFRGLQELRAATAQAARPAAAGWRHRFSKSR
ncbi:cytochrome P450 [Nocardia sp. NPDC052566]|uniref:cytochrome P450 n=1 Tax=Nocardia sp. NPDC052566 TaxID=3364330 RepID=UPI0037C62A34